MRNEYKNKKVVGVIPARMASSRFHGKPLVKILGKEMIQWVYEICMGCKLLKEVYVATDHEDIQAFCEAKGLRYMMTSPDHKNCSERSNEVCQRLKADYVVEIQGDEPTLLPEDIDDFVNRAFDHQAFDIVTQYADITEEQAHYPHNVKIVIGKDQKALFFSRCPIPFNFKDRKPKYYKQVGLFLWPAKAIERFSSLPKSYLESIEDTHMLRMVENGFDIRLVHTSIQNVGVDVPDDVPRAEEYLLKRQAVKMSAISQ